MKMKLFGVVAMVLWGGALVGADAGEMREWTSASGSKIQASLEAVRGETVIFKTDQGKTLSVKMSQLSEVDQALAKAEGEKMAAGNPTDADSKESSDSTKKWYEEQVGLVTDDEQVMHEITLEPGKSERFEVAGLKGERPMIRFNVDIGSELNDTYGKEHVIKMEDSGSNDWVATNIGGGTGFEAKGGKVRLKLSNDSKKTVRIVVTVDKVDLKAQEK